MPETRATAYDSKIEGNVIFTRFDAALNWVRKNSLWPMPMGLACCAIELMATAASRFDISRFGAEVMRFSPRQCDVMIVAGTVTYKMALAVKRIYEQMPEPKWVIAMGACASTGGMYRSYAVLQGIDQLLPVDVYISGCPESRIEEVVLENVRVEIDKTTAYPGGLYDRRPCDVEGIIVHPTAGFFITQTDDIALRNCRVMWGANRPDYYGCAVETCAVTGLDLQNFIRDIRDKGVRDDLALPLHLPQPGIVGRAIRTPDEAIERGSLIYDALYAELAQSIGTHKRRSE